jgi:valyl-tRNA synthetase
MSPNPKELSKAYNPQDHEAEIYQKWEASGAFKPGTGRDGKSPFSVIMPPPNANGVLHTGHAMYVIEDIMVRYRRMQGHPTLWLPGTDHAGIETQVVYERELAKDGKSRFDLGQEKFAEQALAFTKQNQPRIVDQLKRLGFSADWSKLAFTLDEPIVETVTETFKQMNKAGLIYRGNRIVNWCPRCRSSFADIEIKHEDRQDAMYTLDYGSVQIATTRPETIFADAAVAVHPDDQRYIKLVGTTATIPLIDRPIAIIADDYVDPKLGTGALKVTPAHDHHDYEIGQRHSLPEIQVVDLDGKMINTPEAYAGLEVADARKKVVSDLEAASKLVATTPLLHSVAVHDRCGTVIEPLITEQWYLRMAKLNASVIAAIEKDEVKILPKRFKPILLTWLGNEHDWNIGRQNWFGIRIPVYYKTSNDTTTEPYLITTSEDEAKAYYGEGNYRAETDIFDTWFSSGQWPYATLQASGDFERFYPTSVMETGRDILTKWVAKMLMFGLYRTNKVPFHTVYLHGLVNDAHGKKMSKSKGNVLDPLELTAKYGTDALRLALTIGITPGNDGSLSEAKIEGYRNFCNKLWNVARFILGQLPEDYSPTTPEANSPIDNWMMAKLNSAVAEVTAAIEDYRFSDAGQTVYSLLWDDFADWYLEGAKVSPSHDLLVYALETILKLAHPTAPFVTEAIWSSLPWQDDQLIVTPWPEPNKNRKHDDSFETVKTVVQSIRTVSAEEKLSKPTLLTTDKILVESQELVVRLGRVAEVKLVEQGSGLYLGNEAWIEADAGLLTARKSRLEALVTEKKAYLKSLEAKLGNERYVASAPQAIVDETRDRKDETLMLLSKLDEQLADLN